MIGTRLSHYRILAQLGHGGMGVVYRARDERLERDVALKVLPAGALADEAARKQFRKEALALSKLNHPNIATVHDFDTQEGVDFLVMELVPGETLQERLRRGALPEAEIAALGIQLAEGLAAAHDEGVLHRDIKPGNLRVTPKGTLKILDFGLARRMGTAAALGTTESLADAGAVAGTVPYMSPEQLRGETLDAHSDVYAAGAVLYEMAVGRRAFPQEQLTSAIGAILHQDPPAPHAAGAEISPALEALILRCMEKDPGRRPASARELAAELWRLTAGTAARGPGTGRPVVSRAKAARPRLPRTVLVAAAGGAVSLLLALAVFFNIAGLRDRLLTPTSPVALQSLAVLPLVNLSQDPEQEYLSDGLTTELIESLARISSLRVISNASVMALKGTKDAPSRIAERLGVGHLVEGSVLRVGDRVKVSAELIAVKPERVLWADSFEGEVRELLRLQADLSQAIVRETQARLTAHERERLARPRAVDPAAHEAHLRGVYYWSKRDSTWVRRAMAYFQEAVRIDPTYATGWAGVAQGYYALSNLYIPPTEAMPLARAAAERAISLDPDQAEGHVSLGTVYTAYDWNWAAAEREFRRAIKLNPSSAEAHQWYGYALFYQGRLDEALREYEAAEKINPLAGDQAGSIAWLNYMAGRYDAAAERFKRLLEMDPANADQHTWLGLCYYRKSMIGPALEELRRGAAMADHAWPLGQLAYVDAQVGNRSNVEVILKRLLYPPPGERLNNYAVALTCHGLGEEDRAIEWLEKSFAARDEDLLFLNVDPAWASVRSDPRFASLLKRMGFTT